MKHDDDLYKNTAFEKVDERDVAAVMELYGAAIVPVWNEFGRDYDLGRVEENIRANLDNPIYFLHLLRGRNAGPEAPLAGYIAWEKHPDHTSNNVVAHLRMILVHPDRRRSGLASFMLSAFEDMARENGCTKILFDVLAGSPANLFYKRHGYRQWSNYLEKHL